MSFKTIFVPMAFEQTAKSVSDAALKMAHAFHGHVMAHHVRQRFASYPPMEFFPAAASAFSPAKKDDSSFLVNLSFLQKNPEFPWVTF